MADPEIKAILLDVPFRKVLSDNAAGVGAKYKQDPEVWLCKFTPG
jgi:hypothetical protein